VAAYGWLLADGEVANITQAQPLLEGLKAEAILVDKDYDADALIDNIQIGIGIKPAIWLNAFLTDSSNSDGLQHGMKNWLAISLSFLSLVFAYTRIA
jgi:hypothetical protein